MEADEIPCGRESGLIPRGLTDVEVESRSVPMRARSVRGGAMATACRALIGSGLFCPIRSKEILLIVAVEEQRELVNL